MNQLCAQPESWGRHLLSPQQPDYRLLILPDWQGAFTPYIERMAKLFGHALNAETKVFHPYRMNTRPSHYEQEGRFEVAKVLQDRHKVRQWMNLSLQQLEEQWQSDATPLLLVGFCLGGTLAFEAGRVNESVSLSVSLHGDPSTDLGLVPDQEATPFIFFNGGSDPLIPGMALEKFMYEMHRGRREWYMHTLGTARHSFTKQEVGKVGPGSIYSASHLDGCVKTLSAMVPHIVDNNLTQGLNYVSK